MVRGIVMEKKRITDMNTGWVTAGVIGKTAREWLVCWPLRLKK